MSEIEDLMNTRVLVTAGPTWVSLDRVRVLTSAFSGETGLQIARKFAALGYQVTLLMGPGRANLTQDDRSRMVIKQFFYFEELEGLLTEHLSRDFFDVIVHSSAVADYSPTNPFDGKIPSGYQNLNIKLSPTPKLIDMIRSKATASFLIAFKLEVGKTEEELIETGWKSLKRHRADLAVANDFLMMDADHHVAFIVDPERRVIRVENKWQLCDELARLMTNRSMEKGYD